MAQVGLTRQPKRPDLERLLEEAKNHIMTPEEIRQQKISWVYGQMMDCAPDITREEVADVIDEMEGRKT